MIEDTPQDLNESTLLPAYQQQGSRAASAGFRQRFLRLASNALKHFRSRMNKAADDVLEEDDIDAMHAWSISARLAAVPGSYLGLVPTEVAKLIREAQGLHPQMAAGAAERDSRGEQCSPL